MDASLRASVALLVGRKAVIPYDLILTASHRPHLLEPTLTSLLRHVDQPPARILIHDDAALPFRAVFKPAPGFDPHLEALREETKAVLLRIVPHGIPLIYTWADPPRRLGLALRWLLDNVQTEYVLYSQDDHVVVRDLPIDLALQVMHTHHLHQIRFNKRATLAQKETWQGRWKKEEVSFEMTGVRYAGTHRANVETAQIPLTISDHWYFQSGLWRVQPIRAVLHWLTATTERRTILHQALAEEAINQVFDGRFGPIPDIAVPHYQDAMEPRVRQQIQRTFVWGPVGEDRFVRHIGGADPTAAYDRDGGVDDPARAWREIEEYER